MNMAINRADCEEIKEYIHLEQFKRAKDLTGRHNSNPLFIQIYSSAFEVSITGVLAQCAA